MKADDYIARARASVRYSKKHPAAFVGELSIGHLLMIAEPLKIACMTRAFHAPRKTTAIVQAQKLLLRVWSDGMTDRYARGIKWGSLLTLVEPISSLGVDTAVELTREAVERTRSQVSVSSLVLTVTVARACVVGVRACGRFWWQAFRAGIPDGVVHCQESLADSELGALGLWICAELDPWYFPNLPYRAEELRRFVRRFGLKGVGIREGEVGDVLRVPQGETARFRRTR